jgi:hypothetical protein
LSALWTASARPVRFAVSQIVNVVMRNPIDFLIVFFGLKGVVW